MSCQTCGHTMQAVSELPLCHWCPRCGSLKLHYAMREEQEVPKLVIRCRQFMEAITYIGTLSVATVKAAWHTAGVAEAIYYLEKKGDAQ